MAEISLPRAPGFSPQERWLVSYAALAHSLIHAVELAYAAILPFLLVEFGQGEFVLGMVATVFGFAFGVGALPAGVLADRIGSQRLVGICLVGTALASGVVALSPNILSLSVSLSGLGLALGLYHPAGMSLITRGVRARSRGLGYHGVGGNIGMALAPFVAAGLAALFGWRVSYLVPGSLSLLVGVGILLAPLRAATPTPQVANPLKVRRNPDPERVIWGPLLVIFAIFIFTGFIYRGALTFLPLHMKENARFSLGGIDATAIAGGLTTLALMAGTFGQWLGGTLGERMRRENLVVPMAIAVALSLLGMGVVGGGGLVGLSALFAIGHFMGQPVYTALIADYCPPRLQGRMFGISFFLGYGLGSFAAGFAGLVAERVGVGAVFLTLSAVGSVVVGLALYLLWAAPQTLRARKAPGPPGAARGGSPGGPPL